MLRYLPVLLVVAALAGCGDDDQDQTAAPAPTATPTASPTATATPSATPTTTPTPTANPEDQPGGAGDEEPARTLALFTGRGGRIAPRVVRVPAFISVQLELRSADGATYALRFGDTTITAGGELNSVSTTIDGLRPGEAITGKADGKGTDVRISATAEPGP